MWSTTAGVEPLENTSLVHSSSLKRLKVIVPSIGLDRPLMWAVSLIEPPTSALVAVVVIVGVTGLIVEVSPVSPQGVETAVLLASPE